MASVVAIPVIAAGLLLGWRAGVAWTVVGLAATFAMRLSWGLPLADSIRHSAFGWAIGFAVAAGSGWGAETVLRERTGRQRLTEEIVRRTGAERDLRARDERLREAQAIAHVGSWERDMARGVTEFSEETQRILGFAVGAAPQDGGFDGTREAYLQHVDVDDQARVKAALQGIDNGGEMDVTYRVHWPDGTIRVVHSRGRAIHDKEGKLVRLTGSCQDVTQHQLAETRQRDSEAALRRTQDIAHLGSWQIDLVGGRYTASPETARLYGVPATAEHDPKLILAALHPEDRARTEEAIANTVAHGSDDIVQRVVLPDGTLRWLRSRGELELDPQGRPVRILGFSQDITEQREGRMALEARESLLVETQKVGKVGSWEVDLASGEYRGTRETSRLYAIPHKPALTMQEALANVYPADLAAIQGAAQAMRPEIPDERDIRILLPEGGIRWLHVSAKLEVDANGDSKRLVGLSQDITHRKDSERGLAAAEARFRLAAMATRDVVWDWDIATGATYHNEQVRGFGWEPGDLASIETFMQRVHPEDLAQFKPLMELLEPGWPDHVELEYRFRRRDGSYANVLDRAEIVRDVSGKAVEVVGAMADVSEQHHAAEALRAAEERMRSMLDHLDELYFSNDLINPEHNVVSAASQRIFGLAPETLVKDPMAWLPLVHPDDRAKVDLLLKTAFGGQTATGDYRIVRPDGTTIWVQSLTKPIRDDAGAFVRIDGWVRDVTAEKQSAENQVKVKELEDVTAFKTRFLNNAAHELATPLTPIRLQMATMRQLLVPSMNEAQRKSVDLLDRNLDRLSLLVNDLLDAARLQSGKLRVASVPIDAHRVVTDVEASLGPTLREKGIALRVDAPDGPVPLLADEARLHQVLFNVVHNASKFTPRGGTVAVRLTQDNRRTRLAVQDSGIGMTADQISRLFQPFSQVHDTAALRVGGTGLGLYISKSIVEQLGGTLVCTSAGPGKGTTFELSFQGQGAAPAAA